MFNPVLAQLSISIFQFLLNSDICDQNSKINTNVNLHRKTLYWIVYYNITNGLKHDFNNNIPRIEPCKETQYSSQGGDVLQKLVNIAETRQINRKMDNYN